MATYYCRQDGTAANKAAATSSDSASTSMSVTTFNGETFSAGDTIVFSSKGGNFTTTITVPSSGSPGAGNQITYMGEPGFEANMSSGGFDQNGQSYINVDYMTYSGSGTTGFHFDGSGTGIETNDLIVTSSGNQGFQHDNTVSVTHNNPTISNCTDECISTHGSPTVVVNNGNLPNDGNACFNMIDTPNITFNNTVFKSTLSTCKTVQPTNSGGVFVFNGCVFIEHVDMNSRVHDWSNGNIYYTNCKFFNLTDADFYLLMRSTLSAAEIINCTFIGDGTNSTTAVFNQYSSGIYKNNYFVDCITQAFWSATGTIDYNGYYNSGTVRGTNTTTGDPNFDANGDIQNTSSSAYDNGIGPGSDSDIPTDDIYGNTRSGSTCDIGAHEFTSTPSGAIEGEISSSASLSGSLKGKGKLSGTLPAASSLSGALSGKGKLTGSVTCNSSLSGTLTGKGKLSGGIASTSALSCTLKAKGALGGAVSSVSSLDGALSGKGALAGHISSSASLSGALTSPGSDNLSGNISCSATLSGVLSAKGALSGNISSSANFSGKLSSRGYLSGNISISTLISGFLTGRGGLSGAISATAALSGILIDGKANYLSGRIAASSAISGILTGKGALNGSIACVTVITGNLSDSSRPITIKILNDLAAQIAAHIKTVNGYNFTAGSVQYYEEAGATFPVHILRLGPERNLDREPGRNRYVYHNVIDVQWITKFQHTGEVDEIDFELLEGQLRDDHIRFIDNHPQLRESGAKLVDIDETEPKFSNDKTRPVEVISDLSIEYNQYRANPAVPA